MKEKIVTVVSEFTDFKGIVHKFVVAAVSVSTDADVLIRVNEDEERGADIPKAVKLGVAICNPIDTFDEEKGKMIAINKARDSYDYALYATKPGMINTAVVNSLISQEIAFIQNNPDRIIPGYLEEKVKFLERKKRQNAENALSEEEKVIYLAMKEHKFPKVEALLEAF